MWVEHGRKIMKKKIAFLLALLTLTGLLSACGTVTEAESIPDITDAVTLTEALEPTVTDAPASMKKPTVTPAPAAESTFSVTYLDIGQGDAAFIECDGHYMLIDGGDKEHSSYMYSWLKQRDITKLDIVVATHAHSDHVGGLSGALNFASADLILCPVASYDTEAFRSFVKYAEKNGPGITVPKRHDTYTLGSADVEILGLNAGEDTNDTSIVLTVTYEETVFLFTGDAEREAEQAILNDSSVDLSSYVLKVGHHGSDSSTTYPFLREIMPEYAVISCGTGNSYGHPTDNTLSRLRDADVEVLRTDLHGEITFFYQDDTWCLTTDKEASYEAVMTPGGKRVITPVVNTTPAPAGTDYIANKNTMKFHYPDCSGVKRMKESNKVYYEGVTREDMIEKGYDPCGICNP